MARKPAHLERAGALTPRDRMWAAIRALGAGGEQFSGAEVAVLASTHGEIRVDTVMSYVDALTLAGNITVASRSRVPSKRPRREFFLLALARDEGVEAPRVNKQGKPVTTGLNNEQMWLTLRVLKEFNADELALAASTEARAISARTAESYVTALHRGGYLALTTPANGRSKARYRFLKSRNTGPRAPLIQSDKSVMDANTGEVVWRKP